MHMQFSFDDMAQDVPYHGAMTKRAMFIARQRRHVVLLRSALTELELLHSS